MSLLSTKYRSGTKVVHQLFTTSGTWTKPAKFIEGTLIISGIGGGASGNKNTSVAIGGNGGEFVVDKYVNVTGVPTVAVTIGTGGAATTGAAPLAGNSGSPTTFGALLTLAGAVAPTTIAKGVTVGGSVGGQDCGGSAGGYSEPIPHFTKYSGSVGHPITGAYAHIFNNATATSTGWAGGGNGFVLDDTGQKAGDSTASAGGIGYGAGGGATIGQNSGAGAAGALYLTWQEYI